MVRVAGVAAPLSGVEVGAIEPGAFTGVDLGAGAVPAFVLDGDAPGLAGDAEDGGMVTFAGPPALSAALAGEGRAAGCAGDRGVSFFPEAAEATGEPDTGIGLSPPRPNTKNPPTTRTTANEAYTPSLTSLRMTNSDS
ncbi:MAG: hypothetical protein HY763_15490 [Planctomycetes bacterium]|nr:hypothetical protein [Planctomycetota bacterium]